MSKEAKKLIEPNIVLIGPPAVGKSTIAKGLGEILQRPVVDLDEELEERVGMPIDKIIAENGMPYFRDLESGVVADVASRTGQIISTGGGVVLNPENTANLLLTGETILVKARLETTVARAEAAKDPSRPLQGGHTSTRRDFQGRRRTRAPLYEGAATWKVENNGTKAGKADDKRTLPAVSKIADAVVKHGILDKKREQLNKEAV